MSKARSETRRPAALRKGTGALTVYQELRRRIIDLELQPGSDLEEDYVVRQFGVSRTPVREAFHRLSADGLIVLLPNRGARVAPLDLANLRQFYEALELCQRATLRWAASRASPAQISTIRDEMNRFETAARQRDADTMMHANMDFHNAIAASAGNTYIATAYSRLLAEGLRVSKLALTYDFDRNRSLANHLDRIVDEHRQMVATLESRDVDVAERLGAAHADLARLRAVEQLTATMASEIVIP